MLSCESQNKKNKEEMRFDAPVKCAFTPNDD